MTDDTKEKVIEDPIIEVKTPNMWLATAYIAQGKLDNKTITILPEKADKSDPAKVQICMSGPKSLIDKVARDWWNGDSLWRVYSESYRDIRTFVHS